MDKSLIEKYKNELLSMYHSVKPTLATEVKTPNQDAPKPPLSETLENTNTNILPDRNIGNLVAIVTTLRSIYPLENAKVTVFKGNPNNMEILATAYTDQSGKTESIPLPAPDVEFSQESDFIGKPYSVYNMSVSAEGFRDNIHLNIPIFSGVNTLQRSNMMLLETAGENKGPQIFDESEDYTL